MLKEWVKANSLSKTDAVNLLLTRFEMEQKGPENSDATDPKSQKSNLIRSEQGYFYFLLNE